MKKIWTPESLAVTHGLIFGVLILNGYLTVASNIHAAESNISVLTPEAFVQKIVEIVKVGELSDSQRIGKILGLAFVREQLPSKSGITHTRYTPTSFPSPFNAVPQSFDYRTATTTETSTSFADLGFRLNVEHFCVTREAIESALGSGLISPPPLDSGRKGGAREGDVYGISYIFPRPTKTVRLVFDFEWGKCIQRVLLREGRS